MGIDILDKFSFTYFGVLRSRTSWAKVMREMIIHLISLNAKINIYERKGFLYDKKFPLDYNIKNLIDSSFKGDIIFTFEHPTNYRYLPKDKLKVGFLVYEFTHLPENWVKNINTFLDLVIVPSNFCKETFLKSGVEPHKLRVLRYGFNHNYYYHKKSPFKNKNEFIFLCIANPHRREGLEYLLENFIEVFKKQENVKLIIKLTYIPQKKIKPFEYNLNFLFKRFKSYMSKIKIISEVLSEEEMGELYRNADCYVSFSRAEGFGLCFLEALACGIPVISLRWGGQLDFLNDKNSYLIDCKLVPTKNEEYDPVKHKNFLALPNQREAKFILFKAYQREVMPSCILEPHSSYYWWENITRDFLKILEEFI